MSSEITRLLGQWAGSVPSADEKLVEAVYQELKRIARRQLRNERTDHTLQCTALVHEAYVRLSEQKQGEWRNRSQFYGVASEMVRRVLVDYARSRNALKRGAGGVRVTLDEPRDTPGKTTDSEIESLDDALRDLERLDPQQARVVELRFFGGFSIEETAEMLGIHPSTVKRDWIQAKLFLRRVLSR